MASSKHIELSDYIKSVHQHLRDNVKNLGAETAWRKHCADEDNLKKYANAMQDLAQNHWEIKQPQVASRVHWATSMCQEYFSGSIKHFRTKERQIANLIQLNISDCIHLNEENVGKLALLDVGSCYNPFKTFDCFDTVAIDISPANANVLKCDFLHVPLGGSTIIDRMEAVQLKNNHFHVVVFSLLLEYLPCCKQRYLCCEKAYELLQNEGLLIIVTPDSKHVGANAQLMKSWRVVLAKLGFSRIKYEKLPHIHCMAFRKSLNKAIPRRWAVLQKTERLYEDILIPQDFNSGKSSSELTTVSEKFNDIDLKYCFSELPNVIGDDC